MIWIGAVLLYAILLRRGVRRSQANIMAGNLRAALRGREQHSWRWWLWTALCRPSFMRSRSRTWVRVSRFKVPLPRNLPPTHMRPAAGFGATPTSAQIQRARELSLRYQASWRYSLRLSRRRQAHAAVLELANLREQNIGLERSA